MPLRSNDFEAFFATRFAALLNHIEAAMGKPIVREAQALTAPEVATVLADPAE